MSTCDFNKMLCNFIEIAHWHGFSPVNLLHTFKTLFPKSTTFTKLINILNVGLNIESRGALKVI